MLRKIKYETEERWWRDDYGRSETIVVGDIELKTGHGRDDWVDVFRDGPDVYVLSMNSSLPAIGLAHFNLDDEPDLFDDRDADEDVEVVTPTGEVFFQEWQVDESFEGVGDPFDMDELAVVRHLENYLG